MWALLAFNYECEAFLWRGERVGWPASVQTTFLCLFVHMLFMCCLYNMIGRVGKCYFLFVDKGRIMEKYLV